MSQKKFSKGADPTQADQPEANKWRDIAQQDGVDAEDGDQEASPASGETSKAELNEVSNALEEEVALYKDQAIRAKAELENVRRRLERDVSNAHKYGNERLLVDLLPVIDSLVRGLEESQTDDPATQALRKGMELTLEVLHKVLKKNGIEEISPEKGADFNPEQQEAVTMQPDPDAKENTVLQVLQRGYMLNGRVIRAAMVIVAS